MHSYSESFIQMWNSERYFIHTYRIAQRYKVPPAASVEPGSNAGHEKSKILYIHISNLIAVVKKYAEIIEMLPWNTPGGDFEVSPLKQSVTVQCKLRCVRGVDHGRE